MTGELTSQGLIDFRKATLLGVPTATMALPGSNTRRLSIEGSPLQSSLGIFRDRLRDIGEIDYTLQDPRSGLRAVTVNLRAADVDGDIRSIVNRYGAFSFRGSPLTIDIATKSPVADWPRWFTGIIDGIEPASGLEWNIAARVDDRAMVDGTFRAPRVTSFDYPYALAPDLERLMQVTLGLFDSRDGTVAGSSGSIPLTRLNESDGTGGFPYKYLACASWASSVRSVNVNGTRLSNSNWIRTYTTRNGIDSTEVWLVSDPGSTAKVTADMYGIGEDVAGSPNYLASAGTGSPITNLVKQVRWLLRSYVWSSYRTGAHLSDPAALHTASWDAAVAWADARRFRGSIVIDDVAMKPVDLFNAFMEWAWIRAGWTRQGQLALYPFDDEATPYYSDTRWIRFTPKGSEDSLRPSIPPNRSTHQIRSASWLVPASSASRSIVSVRDSRVIGNVAIQVDRNLGSARQEWQDGYPGQNPLLAAFNAQRPGPQGDAVYLSHGGSMLLWTDIAWSPASTSFDFPNIYRTSMRMAYGGGSSAPKWFNDGPNAMPYVKFDGVDDLMSSSNTPGSTNYLTVWCVFRLAAATLNNAAAWQNHGIFVDVSGGGATSYWGLTARTSGGNYFLQFYTADLSFFYVVEKQISLNTWYFARGRCSNGNNYLSINNWDESVASSNAVAGGGALGTCRMGRNAAAAGPFTGDIAAAYVWGNGDLASQGNSSGDALPGLGHNFDAYQALTDRFRL